MDKLLLHSKNLCYTKNIIKIYQPSALFSMKEKIQNFFSQEKGLSKLIFGGIAVILLAIVFSPGDLPGLLRAGTYPPFQRIYPPVGCGYGFGYAYGGSYGQGYGCFTGAPNEDGSSPVDEGDIGNLVAHGLAQADGGDATNTDRITTTAPVRVTLGNGVQINIPSGTTLVAPSNTNFTQLTGAQNTISLTGQDVQIAFDFGLPALGITLSQPISITVPVPGVANGQNLNIHRRSPGGSTFEPLGTCIVTNGTCTFQTSQLSTFTASLPAAGTPGGGGGGGGIVPTDGEDAMMEEPADEVFGYGMNGEEIRKGNVVRTPADPAVYHIDSSGRRHVFMHINIFRTWFGGDFSSVIMVDAATIASFPLHRAVTYRPGSMVKTQDSPKVYLVMKGRQLKHIMNEQVASDLFGANWNQMIYDLNVASLGDYNMAEGSIASAGEVDLNALQSSSVTINSEMTGQAI